jgi:3-oxoacyl-[acyl-carrier protein] reductase
MAKIILVTGASTGIGAATAVELAENNVVFIHYNRSEEEARAVASSVEERGGSAYVIQADLMTEEGCHRLMEGVHAKTDRLDVLINNAGGLVERHDVPKLSWDLMHRIFTLNTYSTMMMTTLCVPLLEKGESPCIVNITSIAMRLGAPTATIYGASKGAVDSFTRGSARELAPKIRVNAVAPGVIVTPFHDKYTPEDWMKKLSNAIPLNELGEAKQISSAIRFLVDNDFITGETIDVNGGHFMR